MLGFRDLHALSTLHMKGKQGIEDLVRSVPLAISALPLDVFARCLGSP